LEGTNALFRSIEVSHIGLGLFIVVRKYGEPVVDQNVRLQRFDERESRADVPEIDEIPFAIAVKPKNVDLSVVGKEFTDLSVHIGDIFLVVTYAVVGVMPISWGIIDAEAHIRAMTGFRDFLDDIPFEGRVHDVVVGELCIPHAEATVMLGGDHDIPGSAAARDLQPLVRVKIDWIELLVEMVVDGVFDITGRIAGDIQGLGSFARPTDFRAGQAGERTCLTWRRATTRGDGRSRRVRRRQA
jgi:hypothetical protein